MTIAMCYLSPEGVVLGADSTTTAECQNGNHYLNNNQKLFQIGEESTVAAITWGCGCVGTKSHRTLFAMLHDSIVANPANSVEEIANRFSDIVWEEYHQGFSEHIARCKELHRKKRDNDEEYEYQRLANVLVVGYCIAGYHLPKRNVLAYELIFDPLKDKPRPQLLRPGVLLCWGVPNLIKRLLFGCADEVIADIMMSGFWTSSDAVLMGIINKHRLHHADLPIRDAIDFVHTCIYSTIKAMKFSSLPQVCGGPIELAVITTDRRFRWVKHKPWDVAISEGAL